MEGILQSVSVWRVCGCVEGVRSICGGCVKCVWRVCVEGVWSMRGGCVWSVCGGVKNEDNNDSKDYLLVWLP